MTLPNHLKDLITQEAERAAKEATAPLTMLPGEQWKMYLEGFIDGTDHGATFLYNYLSKGQGAGVWVKATDRLPDYREKFIKIEGTRSIGKRRFDDDYFLNDSGDLFPADQVEWLDESALPSSELIRAYKEYSQLLNDELNEILPFAGMKGWNPDRLEKRNQLWAEITALSTHQNTDK